MFADDGDFKKAFANSISASLKERSEKACAT